MSEQKVPVNGNWVTKGTRKASVKNSYKKVYELQYILEIVWSHETTTEDARTRIREIMLTLLTQPAHEKEGYVNPMPSDMSDMQKELDLIRMDVRETLRKELRKEINKKL